MNLADVENEIDEMLASEGSKRVTKEDRGRGRGGDCTCWDVND